jgi:hypothetical protein
MVAKMARPHGGYNLWQIPAGNPRQMRPAIARKISEAIRARSARKERDRAEGLQAITDSGIKLKSAEPTPREIERARQKMNRRGFIARLGSQNT